MVPTIAPWDLTIETGLWLLHTLRTFFVLRSDLLDSYNMRSFQELKKTASQLGKKRESATWNFWKGKDLPHSKATISTFTLGDPSDASKLADDGAAAESSQHRDVYIALMGVTGAGKSTFISKCTQEKIEIGETLESCKSPKYKPNSGSDTSSGTQEVKVYPFTYDELTTVHLIDTPGFDDSRRSNVNVLGDIAAYLTDIKLDGIIYLQRINVTRFQGADVRSMRILKKLCGPDWINHVLLVTTCWEQVAEATGNAK